jgi:hypothetical protein
LKKQECNCPNYRCHKQLKPGFESCLEYLKHSINCRPLFRCQKCGAEFIHKRYLSSSHKKFCGKQPKVWTLFSSKKCIFSSVLHSFSTQNVVISYKVLFVANIYFENSPPLERSNQYIGKYFYFYF